MISILESNLKTIRIIYLLQLIVSVVYLYFYGISFFQAIFVYFMFTLFNGYGIIVTYHRALSHRSFEFKYKILEYFGLLMGMLSCSGSALGWAGIHRNHHRYSDTEKDPHNARDGFWKMISLEYNQNFSPKIVVDFIRKDYLMWCHRYYFLAPLIYAVTLYLIGGVSYFVLGFALPSLLTLFAQGFTNYYTHWNYKPMDIAAGAMLNFGDNWHESHHNNPSKTRYSKFDLSGFLIKYIGKNHG